MQERFHQFRFLLPVFRAFHEAGEGHEILLVGGCVRDAILGHKVKDFDFCTNTLPEKTAEILRGINARVVDKNGGNFGTVHAVWNDHDIEITTFRQDKNYPAGDRRPIVEFSNNLMDDLRRRDFTINTMCLGWMPGMNVLTPLDPLDGLKDLESKVLRSPQDARKLMSDDPLRIMRAYRFAHRFGLTIDPELRAAIRQYATNLKHISRERIHDELLKIAGGPQPELAFREMMEDGVMQQIIPELSNQVGYDQENPHHHLPLWEHTLEVVKHTALLGGNRRSVITALLHDVAKPISFQRAYECVGCGGKNRINYSPINVEELFCGCHGGRPHELIQEGEWTFVKKQFLGHDSLGADMARDILRRLKFSLDDIDAVALMIDLHQMDLREGQTRKVQRRFANKAGHLAEEFIPFLKGDRLGHTPGSIHSLLGSLEELEEGLKTLDLVDMRKPKLPVDGNEVMQEFGLPPGPVLGGLMKILTQAVIDGEVQANDKEGALRLLRAVALS